MGDASQQSEKERELTSLSLILRLRPEAVGIEIDTNGSVDIETLLAQGEQRGRGVSRSVLEEVVRTNTKQRFAISGDCLRMVFG